MGALSVARAHLGKDGELEVGEFRLVGGRGKVGEQNAPAVLLRLRAAQGGRLCELGTAVGRAHGDKGLENRRCPVEELRDAV